jgi:hypothetical protein
MAGFDYDVVIIDHRRRDQRTGDRGTTHVRGAGSR